MYLQPTDWVIITSIVVIDSMENGEVSGPYRAGINKQIMNKVRYSILACLVMMYITWPINGYGQLQLSTAQTPQQLVQNVLVGGGVTVSNVVYNGAASSIGSFANGNSTNIGLDNGVIMSSGNVMDAAGPVSVLPSTNMNFGSDPQLASLVSSTVYDAMTLEFDFIPTADTIKFRYVFGSDEYPEYVGNYNDVFGFFISGPNPAFGNYVNKNIALIPGTNLPVTINNINNVTPSYPQYYVDNQGMNGTTITYDGFTVVMTAWALVVPCVQYHIKLAIGDVFDGIYDSAVFLEANSFVSTGVSFSTQYSIPSIGSNAVEGCNNAIVGFTIPAPQAQPFPIYFGISGTAINGVDYDSIPNVVVIPPGQDSISLTIYPILDGLNEGTETIILYIQTSPCTMDTLIIDLLDNDSLITVCAPDTLICGGQATLSTNTTGGIQPYVYNWSNGGTTNPLVVSPTVSTTYTVTVTDACGNDTTDQMIVGIGLANVMSSNDTAICIGGTADLWVTGGQSYQWSNGVTAANNPVSPTVTTTYTLTVSGQCPGYDTIVVTVNPLPNIQATAALGTICSGFADTLLASGGESYLWTATPADPSLTGQESMEMPVVTPASTTTYTLTGTDSNSCVNTATVDVKIIPPPTSDFSISSNPLCEGEIVTISYIGTGNPGALYTWDFGSGIFSGSGAGPYQVHWDSTGTYVISLIVDENGCVSPLTLDSVDVNPVPEVNFSAVDLSGCAPVTTTFTDESSSVLQGAVYNWNFGDGNSSSNPNPVHSYTAAGTYSVTLEITNPGSCVNDFTITNLVEVYPSPEAYFVVHPEVISIFDPVTFFQDASSGNPVSWEWNMGDGNSMNIPSFNYTYADTGHYNVSLLVTNDFGCTDSTFSTIWVRPDYTFYIPNAFTPNGDGLNDEFHVYAVNISADEQEFFFRIFDRWGKTLFITKDVNEGWDGTHGGKEMPMGVYIYRVKYRDAINHWHDVTGKVNLIR